MLLQKSKMLLFLLLTISLAHNGIDGAIGPCDFRRTDDCYKKAITLSQIEVLALSEDNIKEACEIILDVFECLENFIKKCLSPVLHEVNAMLTAKPRQMLMQACIRRSDVHPYDLSNVSCIPKTVATADFKSYTDVFLDAMERAALSKPNEKTTIFCCGVENLFRLTILKINETCGISNSDKETILSELPVSRLRHNFCEGLEMDLSNCSLSHSSSPRGQYGDLRIVKSMSSFMEILIAETFEIS